MGTRGGLAARAGRVRTEATGRFGCTKNRPQSEQYMFSFTGNLSTFYSHPDLTAKRKKTDLSLKLSDLSHLSISAGHNAGC